MTRPEIIRADTIDLQDRIAPSAQDHSHAKVATTSQHYPNHAAPSHLAPSDAHHTSSHQSGTIRGVAAETAQDIRISWNNADFNDLQLYGSDLATDISNSLHTGHSLQSHSNMTTLQQQDALAVAQNGGLSTDNSEDDIEDIDDGLDDDDMMDKISSSPSIEDEDIDFDFVYALHTFQATVEGQANATKGDTMVLLDDSNSYWWLVRVVKDSSIGYLPAEHIETPSERLARLNKHRNIDLSAAMLGDQADKTKNSSLMAAMRRKKAKTVAFAAPTYVDYDVDYSSDEEDLEAEYFAHQAAQQAAQQQQEEVKDDTRDASQAQAATQDAVDEDDESAKVEPLKPRAKEGAPAVAAQPNADDDEANKDVTRSSEDIFEASKSETPGPKKTKDGTVRDSFFKDDTVETKKITLTPNLLRDDSAPRTSSESKDAKQRPSIDRLDKDINALLVKDDKKKKDKKDKDKKQGGFRSLFSRKDKKRGDMEDDESIGKRSMDTTGGYSEKDGDYDDLDDESILEKTSSPPAAAAAAAAAAVAAPTVAPLAINSNSTSNVSSNTTSNSSGPQRHPSKLQKQQPLGRIQEVSPTRKQQKDGSVRMVDPEAGEDQEDEEPEPSSATSYKSSSAPNGANGVSRSESSSSSRPRLAAKAPTRAVLDEFDSDDEVDFPDAPQRQAPVPEEQLRQQAQQQAQQAQQQAQQAQQQAQLQAQQQAQQQQQQQQRAAAQAQAQQQAQAQAQRGIMTNGSAQRGERLSESPVQVSPVNSNHPPALMVDTSSQEEDELMDRSSPISSPSPELVESATRSGNRHFAEDSITTSTSATTANTATWNDNNLRAFFDSGADVRDLLAVVYDKSDVEPAGADHPVAGNLFKEQNAKLAEITTQLDNMLGDWLARKQRLRGTL